MSNQKASAIFPSSAGHFKIICKRVLIMILELLDYIYCWPDQQERKEIAEYMETNYYIDNCIGIGDGTLLLLAFKPSRNDAADFFSQKSNYSLTCFIIYNHLKRIRYYHAGWPGNVHNERVFRNTKICLQPNNYFDTRQYILSDSAITARDFVVPQYKVLLGDNCIKHKKQQFNMVCAAPRVLVKHCIGRLKARFPFLCDIRLRLREDLQSIHKVQRYI